MEYKNSMGKRSEKMKLTANSGQNKFFESFKEETMRVLKLQEVQDILVGCTILGTGGGGSLDEGLEAVNKAYEKGYEFKLLDFNEIDDEKYYINPYFCGTVSPKEEKKELGNELVMAVKALEDYMSVKFSGVVSIEYGGGNTGQAMAAAAEMGKYIVDADAAGRAVPELQFSTYYVTDKPLYPFSVATKYGDIGIFPYVKDDSRAEALSRFMAVGSEGSVGMADHPIKGENLKKSVIPNALSYAGLVGKAQRESIENGLDPVEEIIRYANGHLLFEGVVMEGTEWCIKDGFTVGTINIKGKGYYLNDEFKIWYKNENMISWKNGKQFVTCPDLICVVDNETGYPITNPNCRIGDKVAVLGFEAHDLWKTEKGLGILNPRFFGFDMDCKFIKDCKDI